MNKQLNYHLNNYYPGWTLFKKEVLRFIKVYHQTLLSPVVNVLLLLAIFSLALGNKLEINKHLPFQQFISCGLIMMAAMQNAFANSSSSLVMGKVLGNVIDYLIPPIEPIEMLIAMTAGAMVRGIMVGIICFIAISVFVPLPLQNPAYCLLVLTLATIFLGLLGVLCGIFSSTFDHMSAITSYFITPLTFLSGTFYSTNNLPPFWHFIAHLNPFFYMIDGFRYAALGAGDENIITGLQVMIISNLVLGIITYLLLKSGYKIKN